jgi:superoxide dismutase, Fe-Mn family
MFTLPNLPFDYKALEPHISEEIMKLHHVGHHATYVKNLNTALESYPNLQEKSIEELLTSLDQIPEVIRTTVRNNGGGHYNHSLFWQMLSPDGGGDPTGEIKEALNNKFDDFESFKKEFSEKASKVFGSGWLWLTVNNGELEIISTPNQDTPISGGKSPLLGVDVWEHAYYLQYKNKRADYITAWWNIVNWEFVGSLFQKSK